MRKDSAERERCMPWPLGSSTGCNKSALTAQNVLEYSGSKADRQIIRKHEFYYADGKTKDLKFDVLLVCSHFKSSLTVASLYFPRF